MDNVLFNVSDVINEKQTIIFGKNLHIPNISDKGFDWSLEAMLVAMELASDNGVIFPKNNTPFIWDYNFNCIINGVKYNVHDTNNGIKINLI